MTPPFDAITDVAGRTRRTPTALRRQLRPLQRRAPADLRLLHNHEACLLSLLHNALGDDPHHMILPRHAPA